MQKILIATSNQGKKKEMLEFFKSIKNIEFLSFKDFPEHKNIPEPDENGQTFEENALIKAKFYAEFFNIPTISEDSGLILSAFPNKFGLKTKREIKAKDDHEWLTKFLEILDSTTNRQATFYSAMALYIPKNNKNTKTTNSFTVLGQTSGIIEEFPQTPLEPGIPVSAVFTPESLNQVFSSMSKMQKNKISHRGKSSKKMKEIIIQNFE